MNNFPSGLRIQSPSRITNNIPLGDVQKYGTGVECQRPPNREFPAKDFARVTRAFVTPYVYSLMCVCSFHLLNFRRVCEFALNAKFTCELVMGQSHSSLRAVFDGSETIAQKKKPRGNVF